MKKLFIDIFHIFQYGFQNGRQRSRDYLFIINSNKVLYISNILWKFHTEWFNGSGDALCWTHIPSIFRSLWNMLGTEVLIFWGAWQRFVKIYATNILFLCIFKTIKNSTGTSVVFLINMSKVHFVYVSTSLPFVRERYSKNWTRLHTSAKFFGEKIQIHKKKMYPS